MVYILILHMERRAVFRLTLATIVKASRRDIGVSQPLLHFGDVRFVR